MAPPAIERPAAVEYEGEDSYPPVFAQESRSNAPFDVERESAVARAA